MTKQKTYEMTMETMVKPVTSKDVSTLTALANNFDDSYKAKLYKLIDMTAASIVKQDMETKEWNATLTEKNAETVAKNEEITAAYAAKMAERNLIDVSQEYAVLDGLVKSKVSNVQVASIAGVERYLWQDSKGGWRLVQDIKYTAKEDANGTRHEEVEELIKVINDKQSEFQKLTEEAKKLQDSIVPLEFKEKAVDIDDILAKITDIFDNKKTRKLLNGSYADFALLVSNGNEDKLIKLSYSIVELQAEY